MTTHSPSVIHRPEEPYTPWLPSCTCGAQFRGYASEGAATIMAYALEAHVPPTSQPNSGTSWGDNPHAGCDHGDGWCVLRS